MHIIRNELHDQGSSRLLSAPTLANVSTDFTEVETPILLRSSPEGAREFLVPARSSAAYDTDSKAPIFYALSQSPQQPKQLLICSGGIDKYFQIAKCFRDEDGRKDRQPEFTQVDLEIAFVSWGSEQQLIPITSTNIWRIGGQEVREVVESLVRKIWKSIEGIELPEEFSVMSYHEAMTRVSPGVKLCVDLRRFTPKNTVWIG